MKSITKLLVAGALVLGSCMGASAQVYVKVRPAPVVVERPARPAPTHVWVEDEYVVEGHGYKLVPGHWEAPPRHGAAWHKGHWVHERRGEYWVAGGWK